jgi:hypothetical protein
VKTDRLPPGTTNEIPMIVFDEKMIALLFLGQAPCSGVDWL